MCFEMCFGATKGPFFIPLNTTALWLLDRGDSVEALGHSDRRQAVNSFVVTVALGD